LLLGWLYGRFDLKKTFCLIFILDYCF